MKGGYRVHDHLGQGWIEVPLREIQELGLAARISGRSRIDPGGEVVYVHEREDFKQFIAAKGIRPEALELDEDVVVRSPVGGYPEFTAETGNEKSP